MDENKVMLSEVIEAYAAKKTDVEKNACMNKYVKVVPYVDHAMKVAVSRQVIKNICYDENTMEFQLNTPERYIGFVLASIGLYTNIDTEENDDYTTYDLLKTNGFLEDLFNFINASTDDYKEFGIIWNMCFEDIKEYYSSIEMLLRKAATRIGLISEIGLNKLANALNEFDVDKYAEALSNSPFLEYLEELTGTTAENNK